MKEEGWRYSSAAGLLLIIQAFPRNGDCWRSSHIYPNMHLAPLNMFLDFLMLKKKIAKCLYQSGTLSGGNLCKVSCCQVNKFFKNIQRQRQLEKAHSNSCHSPADEFVFNIQNGSGFFLFAVFLDSILCWCFCPVFLLLMPSLSYFLNVYYFKFQVSYFRGK